MSVNGVMLPCQSVMCCLQNHLKSPAMTVRWPRTHFHSHMNTSVERELTILMLALHKNPSLKYKQKTLSYSNKVQCQ